MERINTMAWVAKYFGKTVEECIAYAKGQAFEDYCQRWASKPRKTDKQCREFYLNGEEAIYRQACYRAGSTWELFTDKITPFDKVLDYGCGIAQSLQCFIDKNPRPDITLADVPSSTFEYAKWRYGDKVKYITIKNNHPLKEKYDWIICMDVLEHIPKAYKVFKHIFKHLKPGGNLIFWYETAPSAGHLIKSTRKNKPKVYYHLMKGAKQYMIFTVEKDDTKELIMSSEWWVKEARNG
jgi:2-polyprenyl-3-methyl-5-hydroxy-6-metoxy-1,4-benzoquinol methylase